MKKILTLGLSGGFFFLVLVLLIFFLAACGRGEEENEMIGPFLRARADFYQEKDKYMKEMQEVASSQMPLEGEKEEEGALDKLDKLEVYFAEGAFDRLIANGKLLDEDFFQEDLDKVQVENIQYKLLKEEGGRKEMDVTYEKVKTQDGKETREKREEIFSLKKEKGSWKILDIRDK